MRALNGLEAVAGSQGRAPGTLGRNVFASAEGARRLRYPDIRDRVASKEDQGQTGSEEVDRGCLTSVLSRRRPI